MNVILSIKPFFADQILNGNKTIEFRKNSFKQNVERIYIYSSSPVKRITGYFKIEEIIMDTPEKLWKSYGHLGSIDEHNFKIYYKNKEVAYGYLIKSFKKFSQPVDPYLYFENFVAPQSFMYLHDDINETIEVNL